MKTLLSFLVTTVATLAFATPVKQTVEAGKTVRQEFPMSAAVALRAVVNDGDVKVTPARGDKLIVHVRNETRRTVDVSVDPVSATQWRIDANQQGLGDGDGDVVSNTVINGTVVNNVVVSGWAIVDGVTYRAGATLPQSKSSGGPLTLELEVPERFLAHLDVHTGDGDVEVRDFAVEPAGPRYVRVHSGDGDVTVGTTVASNRFDISSGNGEVVATGLTTAQPARIASGDGPVTLQSSQGPFWSLELVDGDATVTRVTGDVMVAIEEDGGVEARNNAGNIQAKTGDGDIEITGQTGGTVRARTGDGDITLGNPKAVGEDAKTKDGDVEGRTTKLKCAAMVAAAATPLDVFAF